MSLLTGDKALDDKIEEWMRWDQNPKTIEELKQLIKEKNLSELKKRLFTRMEFGTAGLRACMGAGYSMMNDLTIIQTTQGFVRHMESVCPNLKTKGVVVGYDARHNSQHWAEVVANILVNRGIRVYKFSKITPTPFVPFSVLHYGCDWGIMITASHNPKQDNGYKVYFSNGAQIIPPHDEGIAKMIELQLSPEPSSWELSQLSAHPLLTDPYTEIRQTYMQTLKGLCQFQTQNQNTDIKFTYTAMHGVGYESIQDAFLVFSLPACIPVVEQVQPDPEFPTVTFPNPEEGKSALDLAIKTANKNNSSVILANDPDADRLAVAEKQADGRWHVFSGNELGGLIGWWLWQRYRQTVQPGDNMHDAYFISSTVSSKILKSIAAKEGCSFAETLTGFKWMGNKAVDLMQENKTVLFAFEEAIGFMSGTNVIDKDGVSAAVIVAQMTVQLAKEGSTLYQKLMDIYSIYGHHISLNSYFLCYNPDTVKSMFARLRDYDGSGTYPATCGAYPIKYVRDLTTGYDNSQADNKAILPCSSSSQMLTFTFENGCMITIRTSGTEPKIKYYSELIADIAAGMDYESTSRELEKMIECMVEEFFEPEKNGLVSRPT